MLSSKDLYTEKVSDWVHSILKICKMVRVKGWGNEAPDIVGTQHTIPKDSSDSVLVPRSQDILSVSPDPGSASDSAILIFFLDFMQVLAR